MNKESFRNKTINYLTRDKRNGSRTLLGDVIQEFVDRKDNKKRQKEFLERKSGLVIFIWPGYAPEEEALHATEVIKQKLGLNTNDDEDKTLRFWEPKRQSTNEQSPTSDYYDEVNSFLEKNSADPNNTEKIQAIILTDIKFRGDKSFVDEPFKKLMQTTANKYHIPFHYINANELYGSDDTSLTEEMRDLKFSTAYHKVNIKEE